jgi:hypothetical protein
MQIPPKCQKAAQEPLKRSAEANLSDEQDDSPQQEQGTSRKSYDGSHGLGSSHGTVIDRSKQKNRDSRRQREPRFTFRYSSSFIQLSSS